MPSTGPDVFADAILAGYEAMIRLNLALDGPSILYRGIWPTYFAAPFGIAAVAARLFGLDAVQTAHALALALNYAAPGVGHHNAPTTARWAAAGHAARNGVLAAQAAQAGFTADVMLLDSAFFPSVYGMTPNLAAFIDGLGERDMLAEVSFKPWCAARQTMAGTQAIKEIIADRRQPCGHCGCHGERSATAPADDRPRRETWRPRVLSHQSPLQYGDRGGCARACRCAQSGRRPSARCGARV